LVPIYKRDRPYQERQIEALDQAEEPQAPGDVPRKRLRLVTRDPFIREKFTKERSAARTFAKEYLERYPKDRYQTEIENWRNIQSANIEFTMKRLREPIEG
jgi:hypothetical protein